MNSFFKKKRQPNKYLIKIYYYQYISKIQVAQVESRPWLRECSKKRVAVVGQRPWKKWGRFWSGCGTIPGANGDDEPSLWCWCTSGIWVSDVLCTRGSELKCVRESFELCAVFLFECRVHHREWSCSIQYSFRLLHWPQIWRCPGRDVCECA